MFVVSFIFLSQLSLQILDRTQTGVFPITRFLVNPLLKEIVIIVRTSGGIDMKRGPVTKLDKRRKTTSKKFDNDVMSKNCDAIAIFFTIQPIQNNSEDKFWKYSP